MQRRAGRIGTWLLDPGEISRYWPGVSPVNWRNLPVTCGTCHAGPFVAFQKSEHFALLQKGDARVPTCATCHGAVAAQRPSVAALAVLR